MQCQHLPDREGHDQASELEAALEEDLEEVEEEMPNNIRDALQRQVEREAIAPSHISIHQGTEIRSAAELGMELVQAVRSYPRQSSAMQALSRS